MCVLKTAVIFGVTGLLGSNLVYYLKNKYDNLRIIGVARAHLCDYDMHMLGLTSITMEYGSITDYDFVRRVITDYEVDYVYHLAAQSIVRIAETNPVNTLDVNVMGTVNVLQACVDYGNVKGIVALSSDKYYGQLPDLPYKEDQKPNPGGFYEVSKTLTDIVCQAYGRQKDLPVICARGANLYGPGDMNFSRLIPGSILRILNNESPILYDDVQDYIREFLYVEDACHMLDCLVRISHDYKGESVNLGSGYYEKVINVIKLIIGSCESDLEIDIRKKDVYFKEIPEQYLCLDKLKSMIGDNTKPMYTVKESMERTIYWYNAYGLGLHVQNDRERWFK